MMQPSMKVFITGGTGFVGRNFIRYVLKKLSPNGTIYLLVRRQVNQVDPRVKLLIGDLEHIDKFTNELCQSDYVFHLGAISTFGDDEDYEGVNYVPTKKMVDLLSGSKVLKGFVFLSTIGAIDRVPDDDCSYPITNASVAHPTSMYGRSKFYAEQYVTESALPYVIIRPTWVYGKDMRRNSHINVFVSMIVKKSIISHLFFQGRVSLVHNDDLCAAMANCIDNPGVIGKKYFAVTESISLGEIFVIVYEKLFFSKPLQITVPRFSFIFRRIHSKISLKISNLFLDYLCAQDHRFVSDFHLNENKNFSESVGDVIDTNVKWAGYWIITGANSGIGFELAMLLRKRGKNLILIDIETDRLKNFEEDIVLKADLADYEQLIRISVRTITADSLFRIFCSRISILMR